MPPKGNEQLQRDVEAIGRSVRLAAPAGAAAAPSAGATAAAVSSLRTAEETRATGSLAENVVRHSSAANRRSGRLPWLPACRDLASPARAVNGGSELEVAASSNGRFVVVGTNGGWANSQDGGRTWSGRRASTARPDLRAATAIHPSRSAGAATSTPPSSDGRPASTARIRPARPRMSSCVPPTTARASRSSTTPSSATTAAPARVSPTRSTSRPIACIPPRQPEAIRFIPPGATSTRRTRTRRSSARRTAARTGRPRSTSGAASSRGSASAATGSPTPSTGNGQQHHAQQLLAVQRRPDAAGGVPRSRATAVSDVTCPVAGLDRCNDGNSLSSHTVAVDDANPAHVLRGVLHQHRGGRQRERAGASVGSTAGATWDAGRVTQVNALG